MSRGQTGPRSTDNRTPASFVKTNKILEVLHFLIELSKSARVCSIYGNSIFEQQNKSSHISLTVLQNPRFPNILDGVFAKTEIRCLGVSRMLMEASGAGPILHGSFLSPRVPGRDSGSRFTFPEMHNTPHETSKF